MYQLQWWDKGGNHSPSCRSQEKLQVRECKKAVLKNRVGVKKRKKQGKHGRQREYHMQGPRLSNSRETEGDVSSAGPRRRVGKWWDIKQSESPKDLSSIAT